MTVPLSKTDHYSVRIIGSQLRGVPEFHYSGLSEVPNNA